MTVLTDKPLAFDLLRHSRIFESAGAPAWLLPLRLAVVRLAVVFAARRTEFPRIVLLHVISSLTPGLQRTSLEVRRSNTLKPWPCSTGPWSLKRTFWRFWAFGLVELQGSCFCLHSVAVFC